MRVSIAASNRGNLQRGVRSFSCAVIKDINARQILDSRGNPTVEVHVEEILEALQPLWNRFQNLKKLYRALEYITNPKGCTALRCACPE